MSDLTDLLEDMGAELPPNIKKVMLTAEENGWTLNKPGLTIALRLNHPTDEVAQPVYISWVVGRTPKGKLSFKHFTCGTQGLSKLSGSDLLVYLQDPTVIYDLPEDAPADPELPEVAAVWNDKASVEQNLSASLGATPVASERATAADIMARQREAMQKVPAAAPDHHGPGGKPVRSAPALRVG